MRNLLVILLGLVLITNSITIAAEDNLESSDDDKTNIEIIIFANAHKNNSNTNEAKEFFSEHIGELNKAHTTEFIDTATPLKFLSSEYNKLKQHPNYKIILHATTQYNLLPSQKSKKFLIKSTDFTGTLTITPTPARNNSFNIAFDGIFSNNRLTKSAKIKAKEVYYFDHPIFGALITVR